MANPSLLTNAEQPVNGLGFPIPSANAGGFTNGQDLQGKVMSNASPYYSMFGAGAGDMSAQLPSGPAQMPQASDAASGWMSRMGGQSMIMPQHYMTGGGSYPHQPPHNMQMPANMAGAGNTMVPNSRMGAGMPPMGIPSQYPHFPQTWPNGPLPSDQGWMHPPGGAVPSPTLKPNMGMVGVDPLTGAAPMHMGDMSTHSLPDLGADVGLQDEKASRLAGNNGPGRVNGDVTVSASSATQHQGMPGFNGGLPASGAATTDMSASKMPAGHSLLGQDGMMNSSIGAMMPTYGPGAQPTTVAAATPNAAATAPMYLGGTRGSMAMPHPANTSMMPHHGMMYPNYMAPRMPMDGSVAGQPQPQTPTAAPPHSAPSTSVAPVTTAATSTPSARPTPTKKSATAPGTPADGSRCPKNIGEVLQPLYELGDEPGRKEMLDQLAQLSQETGTPTLYVPTLPSDNVRVDLYRLYEVIKDQGGLCAVVRKKVWRRVIEKMGMPSPSNVSSLASTLRTHYQKLLLPFECKVKCLDLAEEMNKVDQLRRTRAVQRQTAHSASRHSPITTTNAKSPEAQAEKGKSSLAGTPSAPEPTPAAPGSVPSTSAVDHAAKQQAAASTPSTTQQQAPSSLTVSASMTPSTGPAVTASPLAAPLPTPVGCAMPGPGPGPMWPGQTPMPAPSFPPQRFSSMDPSMAPPGAMAPHHTDPSSMSADLFPTFGPQHAATMPDSYDRMLQIRNAQMQQWKQQQHLALEQQRMHMMTLARASVSRTGVSSSVSSTQSLPSPLPSQVLPSRSGTDVSASSSAAMMQGSAGAATVSSPSTLQSSAPSCAVPTMAASAPAPFSHLLSNGSLGSTASSVPSESAEAASGPSTSSSVPQRLPGVFMDPSAVENAAPVSVKRQHQSYSNDGAIPNLWRVHMMLKAGILADSADCLDMLSILLHCDATLQLFQLYQQPTVLETLLAQLASCLHQVLGGFDDIPAICDTDAHCRFFVQDPSDKDAVRRRDEEYEKIVGGGAGDDNECNDMNMDWMEARATNGVSQATASPDVAQPDPNSMDICEDREQRDHKPFILPDGLRHIMTHIEYGLEPTRKPVQCSDGDKRASCVGEHEGGCPFATRRQLGASWVRPGLKIEAEPGLLMCRTSGERSLAWRGQCVSNLIRSISTLAVNERHMSRHFGLMTVISRVERLFQEDVCMSSAYRNDIAKAWWWPWLELIRADLMVTLVNISGQVDLSCLPTKLVSTLVLALCDWIGVSSSTARDPLPHAAHCSGLSLQRLALEALSKMSIGLGNVECIMNVLVEEKWQCLCGRLIQWVLQKRQHVQYELALVLLSGLVTNDAVSRHICKAHHPAITSLVTLLSDTEHYFAGRGIIAPDHQVSSSSDIVRRAANLLLVLARQRCNRRHFAHHQSRLIILATSPSLYTDVQQIIVDVLFQLGLEN